MNVEVFWLARADVTCAKCRWDEWFTEDLIEGALKRPGSWFHVQHEVVDKLPGREFAIVCVPGHDHRDHSGWLQKQIVKVDRLILFINADEDSCFPIQNLQHPNMKLWVMEPRPEIEYPEGTQFFNCGSARAALTTDSTGLDKTHDWFFAGQINHVRREECARALEASEVEGLLLKTDGFLQGVERETYLKDLASAKVAPCPAGVESQDSFRLHEALELGCVPLVDMLRPDGKGVGYWDLTMPRAPFTYVQRWNSGTIDFYFKKELLEWPWSAVRSHHYWHRRRREYARTLQRQVGVPVGNDLTVVMPTSPIPEHPETTTFATTLQSIRERTLAEVIVMCDGPRPELQGRRKGYSEYLRRLMLLAEQSSNVTPFLFEEHLHQAEMLRRTLAEVDTEFILFCEHDTPLVNEVDFERIIEIMQEDSINLMRLHHEVTILEPHKHLMVDPYACRTSYDGDLAMIRTMQWSQRPHVARTEWYRSILDRYFAEDARTMIEDVMFGIVEHSWRTNGFAGWRDWRLAIYAPEDGNIQRSIHLDGRSGDPKFDHLFKIRYPHGESPLGAPRPR